MNIFNCENNNYGMRETILKQNLKNSYHAPDEKNKCIERYINAHCSVYQGNRQMESAAKKMNGFKFVKKT